MHFVKTMHGILVILTLMARLVQACALEKFLSNLARRGSDSDCRLHGSEVKQIPTNISNNTTYLEVRQTHVRVVPAGLLLSLQHLEKVTIQQNEMLEIIDAYAFANLPRLSSVFVSENVALKKIGAFAFSNLPELTEITITKAKHLQKIERDAFRNIPKLQYLLISNTGLNLFPDLGQIHSSATELIFDFHDNMYITEVPPNAFRGLCSQAIPEIRLTRNGIERVASNAFNSTKMHRLFLQGNQQLSHLSTDAFAGSSELVVLNISSTALRTVPGSILGSLHRISAKSALSLKKFPLFTTLRDAELTYPSHCCALQFMYNNR